MDLGRRTGAARVIAAVVLSIAMATAIANGQGASGAFDAVVVAVHDGDTISVRTGTTTRRLRLVGIDCPESRQPFSARAKRFTSDLVFGRTVRVEGHGLDRYDRLLARVRVNGTDVSEALVRAGLAWQYTLGAPDAGLSEAERAARAARAGLWSDPDPVPPWRWRREHPRY